MTLTSPVIRTGPTALQRATAALQPPFAVVDLAAMRADADDMVRRAGGKPIRVASKSVRCREILCNVLDRSGYQGILAFTLPEALWLAASFDDVLVAYPTADTDALARLTADERLASRVTIARHRAGPRTPIRVHCRPHGEPLWSGRARHHRADPGRPRMVPAAVHRPERPTDQHPAGH